MDDDIALLRKEALTSMSSKVSKYGMDGLFGHIKYSKNSERRGNLTPDITRDVISAFGLKPRSKHQNAKEKFIPRSKHPRCRSATSSPSRSSPSRSYSSYSSSSQSRSRSSSSSSDRSSYSQPSSYSGSSRSTSPKHDPVTRRQIQRKFSDRKSTSYTRYRSTGSPNRKKPRYMMDEPSPPDVHRHSNRPVSNRRISRNIQSSHGGKTHSMLQHKQHSVEDHHRRPYAGHSFEGYRPSSRHHSSRYNEPQPHRSPHYTYHSSQVKHEKPQRNYEDRHTFKRPSQVVPSLSPKHRSKSWYHEKEYKSLHRRRGEVNNSSKVHPMQHRSRESRYRYRRENAYVNHGHQTKDKYVVVEDYREQVGEEKMDTKKTSRKNDDESSSMMEDPHKHVDQNESVADQNKSAEDLNQESLTDNIIDIETTPVRVPGDDGFTEELDYNEEMENVDVHPLADERVADVMEGDSLEHDKCPSPSCSGNESDTELGNKSDDTRASSVSGDARPISSPLRVTPERSARSTNESWSGRGRLPVKQRLYLSKQKLEEKRRSARYQDRNSSADLRPSLANRLGPPQHSRQDNQSSYERRFIDSPSKGNAVAIAEAYRKKKAAQKRSVYVRLHKEKQKK